MNEEPDVSHTDFKPALAILERENTGSGSLIMILQKLQGEYGYLPMDVLDILAKRLNIPIAQVMGTATFYTQFRFKPIGKHVIRVCHGTACHIAGAAKITDILREYLGIQENQTTGDGLFTLERVACIGCCSLAPAVMINEQVFGSLTSDRIVQIIDDYRKRELKRGLSPNTDIK
jgi:NADH-quinone oxidoreductase subunit E